MATPKTRETGIQGRSGAVEKIGFENSLQKKSLERAGEGTSFSAASEIGQKVKMASDEQIRARSQETRSNKADAFREALTGVGAFDPNCGELATSWFSHAENIICLNTYPNGITLSLHGHQEKTDKTAESPSGASNAHSVNNHAVSADSTEQELKGSKTSAPRYHAQQFHLRIRDTRDYQLPAGKYYLHRENYPSALEAHLSQLHKSGTLATTVFYFGTTTDPFLSLHKKFDVTMNCLELLERYVPGLVVFQTRSPMIISVLPTLKHLGSKAVVVMPVESISEKAIARYTPGKPRIGERLVAAEGLRRQGIKVNLQVSPILPYGDPQRDAWDFAEVLDRHADYVSFGCLASGAEADEKQLKNLPVAQRLSSDQQFFWLRPHCYQYVFQAMRSLAPEKLMLPVSKPLAPSQLKLFAA